ncbi:hypothetical protein Drose_34620 [Dactylosporangium roseum]|uniref:FHA domain-containing protein n=1 Tax=Dactylosporangium roseum TaxID=47989 RepID=A0ABY5Z3D2_9ACTN|nr:hypothetical protein [Dactylosporangium roseum]UWZ36139.1 hypothetical protein Drose_34620 [Dactylosporangium roseum]
MRFEVSRVMDTIEQRLTTDVTLAQAVVDLAEVARFMALDGGRPINLLRLGMAIDALSRYLIDAGVMLYPVVGREVLSESALTSKERMVLGRWADDGLIEVTPVVADRPVEIADFTGLPLIVVRDVPQYATRFPWLADSPERILRLIPRAGGAVLNPAGEPVPPKDGKERLVVMGKATLPIIPVDPPSADASADESPAPSPSSSSAADADGSPPAPAAAAAADGKAGPQSFKARGSQRFGRTRVVRRRFTRAEPSGVGAALMAREWQCGEPDCPAFGRFRKIGQPVPRMRAGVPACPRHGQPLKDVGPRPRAFAVAVVVEDLARRRFVVSSEHPVVVGREPAGPEDVSVGSWLHEAAAAWIAKEHVKLAVDGDRLVVTDTSDNGTVIWKRSAPDIKEETERLYRKSYKLDGWDSVELYTGVELVIGDHRLQTVVGSEPASVLLDAPTVALRLVD